MPVIQDQIKTPIRQYSDLDMSFSMHPAKKDVAKKLGDQAVIQSLKNLVQMNFYEKPFKPYIGCNARKLLFENMTPIIANTLKDVILETIATNEPRVQVNQCIVEADYDNNLYSVTIEFYVNNRTEPTLAAFVLQRIR